MEGIPVIKTLARVTAHFWCSVHCELCTVNCWEKYLAMSAVQGLGNNGCHCLPNNGQTF